MSSSGALVIGGGVIGASIAYHLAEKGFGSIRVIDKFPNPAGGSTGKATGGFRAQFGAKVNILLSLLSRQKLLSFKDELGVDPEFRQYGYMFIAQNKAELELLIQANQLQKSSGLTAAEIITPDKIKKLNPYINHNGITGGAICKSDGFISPLRILEGYTSGAKNLGVTFEYGTELKSFNIESKKIKSVNTNKETIEAEVFINAAGAWAGETARSAGVDIPVKPLKRQAAVIQEKNIFPEGLPMTIWIDNHFHFRMKNGRLVMLMPLEPESKDPYSTEIEDSWLEKIFTVAKKRVPKLQGCSIDKENSVAGLYEMSPDETVLLGSAGTPDNFYIANGSSGHGVMHSPAIGQLMAELITGKKPSIDISDLNPSRFNEGKPIESIPFF